MQNTAAHKDTVTILGCFYTTTLDTKSGGRKLRVVETLFVDSFTQKHLILALGLGSPCVVLYCIIGYLAALHISQFCIDLIYFFCELGERLSSFSASVYSTFNDLLLVTVVLLSTDAII